MDRRPFCRRVIYRIDSSLLEQTVSGMGISVDNPDNSYIDNDWEGAHITTHLHWDATASAMDITVIITITD
jgi:hypothetical protein